MKHFFSSWPAAWLAALLALASGGGPLLAADDFYVLQPGAFAHHVERFNAMEDENVTNFVPNRASWIWLQANIPLFECPDREVEEIYYYRWWSLRKHLRKASSGFVFNEFLTRATPVSSALGHQINELRWLHDPSYLDDYIRYWLQDKDGKAGLHKYSGWLEYAVYQRSLVTGNPQFAISLLPELVADYRQWETERLTTNGLFYQFDVRDAMEESISGSRTNKNLRPTINSYMFGNAVALQRIALLAHDAKLAAEFGQKAAELKRLVQATLWNADANFFEVRRDNGQLSGAREELGFIPWYFELPDAGSETAWTQFTEADGFRAPFGITTAERRHPLFRSHGCCHCEWDGAVWPFATSQTLGALANVLRDYHQNTVTSKDYFAAFLTYVHSQHAEGKPYIGEYLDETTGQWFNGRDGRSRYYNHSTFADLVVTGVAGLRPRADDTLEVWPLLPPGVWDWFCLDGVKYHGRMLTIFWDATGRHYDRGAGFTALADGKVVAHSEKLERISGKLP